MAGNVPLDTDGINKKDKMAELMMEKMASKWKSIRNRNHFDEPMVLLSHHVKNIMALMSDCKITLDVHPYVRKIKEVKNMKIRGKNREEAEKLYKTAQGMFDTIFISNYDTNNNFGEKAIEMYSQALCLFPFNSYEKNSIHNDRAHVFSNNDLHLDCIADIDRVLAILPFPPGVDKVALYLTKLGSLYQLKSYDQAISVYNLIQSKIDKKNKNHREMKNHLKKFKKLKSITSTDITKIMKQISLEEMSYSLSPVPGYGNTLKNSTAVVELKYNPHSGLYIKALKAISPGDVVICEKPFSFALEEKSYSHFCSHCMKYIHNRSIVPCRNCNLARYCNEDCENLSWTTFHQYECELFDILKQDIDLHIAFRIVLGKSKTELKEYQKRIFEGNFDCKSKRVGYFDNDYNSLLKLGHGDIHLRKDSMKIAKWAIALGDSLDPNYYDMELTPLFISSMLFYHTLQCMEHSFALYDDNSLLSRYPTRRWTGFEPNPKASQRDEIPTNIAGYAIYSNSSILNHSCIPNTAFMNDNEFGIVCATRSISAGSEVTISFGPQYGLDYYDVRKKLLSKHFGIACKCIACNIPDYELNRGKLQRLEEYTAMRHKEQYTSENALYALNKRIRYLPQNHPDLIYSNLYVAELLRRENDLKRATTYAELSFRMARKVFGVQSPELFDFIENLQEINILKSYITHT